MKLLNSILNFFAKSATPNQKNDYVRIEPTLEKTKKCVFCGDTGFMLPGKWRNNTGKPCTQGCSPADLKVV